MIYPPPSFRSIVFLATATIAFSANAFAEKPVRSDPTAPELLPQTVGVYLQIADAEATIDRILSHPVRLRIESMPAYKALVESGEFDELNQGVAAFEASMGGPWNEALATLGDRGVSLALDSSNGGVALLIHSSKPKSLERLRGFLLAVSMMKHHQAGVIEQDHYRGFTAYALDEKWKLALINDWMVIVNQPELGKAVIDRYLERPADSLASNASFAEGWITTEPQRHDKPLIASFADLERLRHFGVPKELNREKTDHPIAELVFGGVLANLIHTPYACATLDLSTTGVVLNVTTPHDRQWQSPREYYFGEDQQGIAPPLLNVSDCLFAVSAHRDLSQMWLRAGDFVDEKAVDELAKADSNLTTIFSGRDFGEDILGSFESGIQIVGSVQEFEALRPTPAIKLPAVAAEFLMKNPAETVPEMRRVFQSLVGFLNVVGAMEGQPQLDLGMQTIGDAQLITATYVPVRDDRESREASIHYNFSPTLAFAEDRMILSSTIALAAELAKSAQAKEPHVDSGMITNTMATLHADTFQQVLAANTDQLVASNMLEKGHSKTNAENEIAILLELVDFLKDAKMKLGFSDQRMRIHVAVNVNTDEIE